MSTECDNGAICHSKAFCPTMTMHRLVALLGVFWFCGTTAIAEDLVSREVTQLDPELAPHAGHLPGVSIAEGVSQITGVAVSPLLGVSAIGAWKYVQTPEHQRHLLPWYCNPWAWGTGLTLLGLCFLKDFLGTAAPPLVKKPLDFAELFENKASALVASAAFVPLVAAAIAQVDAIPLQQTSTIRPADMGFAAMGISWAGLALWVPLALLVFAVVWLSCHAINVLVALSPFGIVDAGLKLVKLVLLTSVTGAALIHPMLGLVVCLPLILVAALVCGWAFRLTVFGTVFGWDFLSSRRAEPQELEHGIRSFNARRLGKVPTRTYGELRVASDGTRVFRHRPWLVLPAREVAVEVTLDGLTKGLLHPTVTQTSSEGKRQAAFILPPRYRHCVEDISRCFGIQDIADSTLLRGLKAMRHWLVEILSVGRNLMERGQASLR